MKRGSIVAGVLLIGLAIAVWLGSVAFTADSSYFPRAVAAIMLGLTILMLLENRTVRDQVVFEWEKFNYRRTAIIFVITSIYLVVMAYVGFLITTPICLLIMMQVLEKGDWKVKILSSAITTAAIYYVFQMMLDVPLPAWSF